ncbi:lysophospholipid acyltransferase family protein [Marinomonas transparens]|uniref:lysophospholipid acyltransferase family protein n=1 Tax=Marinomonas transparens TaxID=2795388 RepID=UPI001F3D719E|nr:lysophospholipid acyltransferase family protein [Marinomonas transparens]
MSNIEYCWRWLATAFSFFIFGLGGILLPIIAIPILYCLPATTLVREGRAQAIIHHAFHFYIELMRTLGVLSYETKDLSKLKDAQLILANHPSLIDVVFLIAFVPNANCVVKGKLAKNPFTRGPIKTAGYIINENNEEVIDMASQAFSKNHALIVFPEGTRSTPKQALTLKRGAANIAIRTQADITPVIINCTPSTLTKSDRWYQIPKKRAHFTIRVKNKIAISDYLDGSSPSVAARKLTYDLTNYFNSELKLNG